MIARRYCRQTFEPVRLGPRAGVGEGDPIMAGGLGAQVTVAARSAFTHVEHANPLVAERKPAQELERTVRRPTVDENDFGRRERLLPNSLKQRRQRLLFVA